jgi:dihydroflavonol-4-reductase
MRTAARLQEVLAPVTNKQPPVDSYRMRVFGGSYFFDSQKAKQELDYQVRPLETMVQESYDWYCRNHYI